MAAKLQSVVNNFLILAEVSMNRPKVSKINTLLALSQTELQNILLGRLFDYRTAQPTPAIGAQITSDVADILGPYWQSVAMAGSGAIWSIPADALGVAKVIDIRPTFSDGLNPSVQILTNKEYRARVVSVSKTPTTSEPVAEYAGLNTYAINPGPTSVQALYYQAPALTVLTVDGNGVIDFSAATDILWQAGRPLAFLTYLMLRNFGVPLNSQQMVQTGEQLAKLSL